MRALALLLLGLLAVARADVVIRSEVRASELLAGSRAGLPTRTVCRFDRAAVLCTVTCFEL